jgi:hypothetical protein
MSDAAFRWGPLGVLTVALAAHGQAWLPGFATRRPVSVMANATLSDWQVSMTVDTTGARMGCPDLRVTTGDGMSLLPHWVESGCGTSATIIWVRIPMVTPGTTPLFLYRGHSTIPAASNAKAVHDFFDDFAADAGASWSEAFRQAGGFEPSPNATLLLTPPAMNAAGAGVPFSIAPNGGLGFEVRFRFRMTDFGGATSGGNAGGDGFALGFLHQGPSMTSGNSMCVEAPGYAVRFDTYINDAASQFPGEPTRNHVSIVRTNPNSRLQLAVTSGSVPFLRDGAWHEARVVVLPNQATVFVDRVERVTAIETWDLTHRKLVFGAATGGAFATHEIDDVRILKATATAPSTALGAIEWADAGIAMDASVDAGASADGGRSDGGPPDAAVRDAAFADAGVTTPFDAGGDAGMTPQPNGGGGGVPFDSDAGQAQIREQLVATTGCSSLADSVGSLGCLMLGLASRRRQRRKDLSSP